MELGAVYPTSPPPPPPARVPWTGAVRTVDLDRPVAGLPDVADRDMVRVFLLRGGRPIGSLDVVNQRAPVSARRLRETIAATLAPGLLAGRASGPAVEWRRVLDGLTDAFVPGREIRAGVAALDPGVPVSIVVATCDRPDDLRRCLASLRQVATSRSVEILVVDNRPGSGLTPPVVAEFAGVRLVTEPRAGVSYARNAGFVRATGAIVVSVDDDVTVPPAWLEALLAPLARPDVMIATGPLFPVELDTEAQLVFETYGGLGRGFERLEADTRWLTDTRRRSVPTWLLGGTANAAFRAAIFSDPRVGLLDEALGPGTPTGVGEDTYVFYKVLRAGFTVVYDPGAYAWHRHRRTMAALRRQIYDYSKGHVAYHLTTLVDDHDSRALLRLLLGLPLAHAWRALQRLRGRSGYTLLLLGCEILGNLAGPLALWRSRRRVKRLGRSAPRPPAPEVEAAATDRAASRADHG
jgi:GT2 family glycosyltransferase